MLRLLRDVRAAVRVPVRDVRVAAQVPLRDVQAAVRVLLRDVRIAAWVRRDDRAAWDVKQAQGAVLPAAWDVSLT